jgi:hypothetical protein
MRLTSGITSCGAWLQTEGSGGVGGLQGDLVAQLLELADEPLGVAVGGLLLALLEVVVAEVVVGDPAVEQVVGDQQDRVADRDRCPARGDP